MPRLPRRLREGEGGCLIKVICDTCGKDLTAKFPHKITTWNSPLLMRIRAFGKRYRKLDVCRACLKVIRAAERKEDAR